MRLPPCASRRQFLKTSMMSGLAAFAASAWASRARAAAAIADPSAAAATAIALPATRVALTTGNSRADLAERTLRPFADQIARAIADRQVVIKPNIVSTDIQLAATHAESVEGILEFLKSINKLQNAVIAESAAAGPTMDGYENFGYMKVATKYGVKLVDLDKQETEVLYVIDEDDLHPKPVRMARLLLSPNSFVVSAARMKTHDRVVATLSLKNIVVGAPIKDQPSAGWSRRGNDKPAVHGGGTYGIDYNLFVLAQRLHPHLSVIDGYEGMEGNGPTGGSAVDHRICVAGLDWLAADRVAVELMGIKFEQIGYLNYCAQAGLGQADLKRIEVVGESIERHRKSYQLADSIDEQLMWMKPPRPLRG